MFPRGLPGLALLLLRVSTVLALLLNCYVNRSEISTWIQLAAILLALSLCAGFLTPIAASAALLFHVLVWFLIGGISSPALIVVVLDALALALLGPGAYSIDSYRFGLRVVVLQPPR
jgi:putative oxidoreductase